jgi:hypothetical protein
MIPLVANAKHRRTASVLFCLRMSSGFFVFCILLSPCWCVWGLWGKGFMKGGLVFVVQVCGPVVQLGRTSPSRGEDRRFKSGSAHLFCVFVLYG